MAADSPFPAEVQKKDREYGRCDHHSNYAGEKSGLRNMQKSGGMNRGTLVTHRKGRRGE